MRLWVAIQEHFCVGASRPRAISIEQEHGVHVAVVHTFRRIAYRNHCTHMTALLRGWEAIQIETGAIRYGRLSQQHARASLLP